MLKVKTFHLKYLLPNNYDKYVEHIEVSLASETPLYYGLHPNAEIGFRTN
jgi:dynein heavy chain